MRALSLTQPWATLVAIGEKSIETRSWRTQYRGEVAIHAAKGYPRSAKEIAASTPFAGVLALGELPLPVGQIIAVAELHGSWVFGPQTEEKLRAHSARGRFPRFEADFGDFSEGRHGFLLRDVRRLAKPVPASGSLGFWVVPADIERAVREQLEAVST